MADGKIYITISDTRGGSGAGVSNTADKGGKGEKQKSLAKFAQHQFFNLVESEAKQIVNYSISNIGNFSGNYQIQRDVQRGVTIMSKIISIGTSATGAYFAFGGQVTGGVAAAIVVATAVVSEGVSMGMQYYSGEFERKKTNRNIEMMRKRLGLEGLTDGSRTGGY